MVESFPGDGATVNGFDRRHLREDEARLLYEEDYSTPPDMRVPGSWRLSVGGVPVPPPPSRAEQHAKIVCVQSGSRETYEACRGTPQHHHAADGILQTSARQPARCHQRGGPRGRHNSEGRHEWWGVPGRTLEAVLEHIEGGNSSRYE
ncbi:hypothetical protein D1007_60794 [Hordeum vulgare]|nr:hypothetical protein D1007_60794 [Hordeum vulgare]